MDADLLLRLGSDPNEWLRTSATLRRSADALWSAMEAALVDGAVQARQTARDDVDQWDTAFGYLTSAKMLYGLALETAFKAVILRDQPGEVEFAMSADGSGRVHQVELKQMGAAMGAGHDLVRLGEKAGVFLRGADEIFTADSDYTAVRAILEDLGETVVWSGRYPIPRRSGAARTVPMGLPWSAFGHHMRDWTDLILDRFQLRRGPPSAK